MGQRSQLLAAPFEQDVGVEPVVQRDPGHRGPGNQAQLDQVAFECRLVATPLDRSSRQGPIALKSLHGVHLCRWCTPSPVCTGGRACPFSPARGRRPSNDAYGERRQPYALRAASWLSRLLALARRSPQRGCGSGAWRFALLHFDAVRRVPPTQDPVEISFRDGRLRIGTGTFPAVHD